jgi:hypothetical protein
MGDSRNGYRILVGKSEGKDHLENLSVEIKMDFIEIEWEGLCWVNLAQDMDKSWAVLNTVMKLRVS